MKRFLIFLIASSSMSIIAIAQPKKFELRSSSFTHNSFIPKQYTCDGENISPSLSWSHAPKNTKSFALIVDDPDAQEKVWVHWIVFNIPAKITMLSEGVQNKTFIYGVTDFYYMRNGIWQYAGPCPPKGIHHYHFKLYALDILLPLTADASKEDVENTMKGHILAETILVGLYQRK